MVKKIVNSNSGVAKIRLVPALTGGILMLLGFACFIIKTLSTEYVDASGMLHENFFLIPVGFLLLIFGIIIILSAGIYFVTNQRS